MAAASDSSSSECDSQLLTPGRASESVEVLPTARTRPAPTPVLSVVVALVAVQASFGGNAVVVKVALTKSADPVVFSFLRDVGGAAVLLRAGCCLGRVQAEHDPDGLLLDAALNSGIFFSFVRLTL